VLNRHKSERKKEKPIEEGAEGTRKEGSSKGGLASIKEGVRLGGGGGSKKESELNKEKGQLHGPKKTGGGAKHRCTRGRNRRKVLLVGEMSLGTPELTGHKMAARIFSARNRKESQGGERCRGVECYKVFKREYAYTDGKKRNNRGGFARGMVGWYRG